MTLAHHDRYDYSPITGFRLAFGDYLTVTIEHFGFGGVRTYADGIGRAARNYSWRDYGLRTGICRIFDLAEQLGLPLCHLINSTI
jgi:hypothetical protein